jgi:ubiquinone/menaquinone biosynthesis C-methylase UbiE
MAMFEQTLPARADTNPHLRTVQHQFRRQTEVYAAMPLVNDPELLSHIVSISGVAKSHQVLDVACGPGFVTMAFAPHCTSVVGIDATDRFIARAKAEAAMRRLDNVTFLVGDAERIPYPDESFDVAVCRFAVHHFPRPATVLSEMKRIVRPGGRIVIVDMLVSEDSAKAAYRNEMERLCDPSHARALPGSEFEHMFSRLGLELTYKQTFKSTYSVADWIAHGAPTAERAARIMEMMEASVAEDKSGLAVRVTNGKMYFSFIGASYVMRRRT